MYAHMYMYVHNLLCQYEIDCQNRHHYLRMYVRRYYCIIRRCFDFYWKRFIIYIVLCAGVHITQKLCPKKLVVFVYDNIINTRSTVMVSSNL